MLASALDALVERGVEESKLVGKLRGDRDVWPSVAEIVAGRLVLPFFEPDLELEMDSERAPGGPNADFRLTSHGSGQGTSIEFKALGLSSAEAAFFLDAAVVLPDLVPGAGVTTYHVPFPRIDLPRMDATERDKMDADNRRRQKGLPAHIRDLRGAVIAAHSTEEQYLIRVRDRIRLAIRQLDPQDECWVAFWWSNGAPLLVLRDVLSTIDLPNHVLGLMVVGAAVAVPFPEIHYFHSRLPRLELSQESELPVISLEDHPAAAQILEGYEQSAGIRPTLVVEPSVEDESSTPLLFRDGRRHIFPFNLLIGRDPHP